MKKRNAIELTGIFIKDHNDNFTGFFSQFPEAVSQGESFEEAEKRLFDVLPDILDLKEKIADEGLSESQQNVFKKAYSYEPAE